MREYVCFRPFVLGQTELLNTISGGEGEMSKDTVGFIGLGTMGKAMAQGIVKAGIDIVVARNLRHQEPVKELERRGARVARTAKDIGALSNIAIIMVRDTAQAEAVILGDDGLLSSAREGSIIVIMSTIDPLFCQMVEKIAREKSVGVLDAPVSGGPKGAEAHTLTIMVGGEKDLLERCRYVLEAVGRRIFHVGGIVIAQVIQLATNNIIYVTAIATAGSKILAGETGIGSDRFLEIIQSNAANRWVANKWDHFRFNARPDGEKSLDIAKIIENAEKTATPAMSPQ